MGDIKQTQANINKLKKFKLLTKKVKISDGVKILLIGIKNMSYDYLIYLFLLNIILYFLFKKKIN